MTAAEVGSRVWGLDPSHSSVEFAIKHHAVGTFRSRFDEFEATYDADAGTLNGSAQISSLATFDMLKEHLMSDEFLAGATHPQVTFTSTSVTVDGNDVTVVGDFTLRGQTKSETAKGTITGPSQVAGWEGSPNTEHIGLDLQIVIDRRDYGMDFNNELLDGQLNLGWDVALELSLELSKPILGGAGA
jgi:polyisoprenoid-binding protein YceI